MALKKYPQDQVIVDGENVRVRLDIAYTVSKMTISEAISELVSKHGSNLRLLPLSGVSGGAGVFQVEAPGDGEIIGLQISDCVEPVVRRANDVDIIQVALDEILIDEAQEKIYAGSAINLNQLNLALGAELGTQYRVLGADLTSYTYAQVGATFMTGGMGPQRRYFSDSVQKVALHNGEDLIVIEGEVLEDYAGTYGWTGVVSAVCCDFVKMPRNEIAFAMPVNNTAEALAGLLAHFSPYTQLNIEAGAVVRSKAGSDLIMGLEHITSDSMRPFLNTGDNALTKRAAQLKNNCEDARADGLIFVSGFSDLETDEFLFNLVDDSEVETFTIAGINLDYCEVFKDPEQMRAVREGIPYAARMQAPQGAYSFKGHTDVNIRLNPACVELAMRQLWEVNLQYVDSVQTYIDRIDLLCGEILVYGHLNPVGVDPHNRITFACDDETVYRQAVEYLDEQRDIFIRRLARLCEDTGSDFVGGEKSAGSEYEMLPVFGGLENTPRLLRQKAIRQQECIRAASPMFNWRAMGPYR